MFWVVAFAAKSHCVKGFVGDDELLEVDKFGDGESVEVMKDRDNGISSMECVGRRVLEFWII